MFECTKNMANIELNAELLPILARWQMNILVCIILLQSKATYTDSLSYVQIHIPCNSFC